MARALWNPVFPAVLLRNNGRNGWTRIPSKDPGAVLSGSHGFSLSCLLVSSLVSL